MSRETNIYALKIDDNTKQGMTLGYFTEMEYAIITCINQYPNGKLDVKAYSRNELRLVPNRNRHYMLDPPAGETYLWIQRDILLYDRALGSEQRLDFS